MLEKKLNLSMQKLPCCAEPVVQSCFRERCFFLEKALDHARDECAALRLQVRNQEQRLMLVNEIFNVQQLEGVVDVKTYLARLWEQAKMPGAGVQEYCVPRQEMAWMLEDCKSFGEFQTKLRDAADCQELMESVKPSTRDNVQMVQALLNLQSEVKALKEVNQCLRQQVPDQYVPLDVYEKLRGDFNELHERYETLKQIRVTNKEAELNAYWTSLRCYWRREVALFEKLASQEVEVAALRSTLVYLTHEDAIPRSKVDHAGLIARVAALEKALQADFVQRMVNDRSEFMSDVLTKFRDYNLLKDRKNATIQAQQIEISQLLRALGLSSRAVSAQDVTVAQRELDRLKGVMRTVADDLQIERRNNAARVAYSKQEQDKLDALRADVRAEEMKLRRTAMESEKVVTECSRYTEAVDERKTELERLKREINDLNNGTMAAQIRSKKVELDRLQKVEDTYARSIAGLMEEEADLKREVRRLSVGAVVVVLAGAVLTLWLWRR